MRANFVTYMKVICRTNLVIFKANLVYLGQIQSDLGHPVIFMTNQAVVVKNSVIFRTNQVILWTNQVIFIYKKRPSHI